MNVPQARLFARDTAVGFGIELLEASMEIVIVKQVKYLTTVEFDCVDEIFGVVETRQG